MNSFTARQRVRVTEVGHPYEGKAGTVWRTLKRDESAWVTMDCDLLPEDIQFPKGDDRHRNLNIWPDQCELEASQ